MNEDRFEERLRDLARDYHEPPPAPRDAMWERIELARRGPAAARKASRRRGPWIVWPVAAAAVLLLGIAIGRWSLPADSGRSVAGGANPDSAGPVVADARDGGEGTAPAASLPDADLAGTDAGAQARAARPADDRAFAFQLAAAPLLSRSELLLTRYSTGVADAGHDAGYTERARRLLQETRLLLDSPATRDPQLARLLSDLELTLTRVVQAADSRIDDERDVVEEGMEEQGLLSRLGSWTPPGRAGTSL